MELGLDRIWMECLAARRECCWYNTWKFLNREQAELRQFGLKNNSSWTVVATPRDKGRVPSERTEARD